MLISEITCTKLEATSHDFLLLVKGLDADNEVWNYLLLQPQKAPLLLGIAKLFPLKINLNDYGTIICSGEGSEPPLNIRKQIENGNFSNQSGGKPKIYCLFSKDEKGRDFFTYLEVPFYLEQKVEGIIRDKSLINFEEYGRIIESGWGFPSQEVIDKMYREYGATTPSLEHS